MRKKKPTTSQVIRNKKQGKAVQKKIVESLGGENVGTLGGEDGKQSQWSIEVKSCARFVGEKFLRQCESNCLQGKTPIVIVHTTGARHKDDIVMLRRHDWDDWFGDLAGLKKWEE